MNKLAIYALWIVGLSWSGYTLGYRHGEENAPAVAAVMAERDAEAEAWLAAEDDRRLNPETREEVCDVFFDHARDILDDERWADIVAEEPEDRPY